MFDNRYRCLVAAAGAGRLDPFCGKLAGLLGRAFGDLHALRADVDTGVVHHREDRFHAAIFAADHLADTVILFAISHDAGR